jgi:hypothetical protein
MPVNYEQPQVSDKTGGDGQKITHPAYAQISASRVSGGISLYGSEFKHHNYITIRIATSELNRHLSNDWPFERDQIIEVAMSPSQWAEFVSSMNMGSGVQCTLQTVQGKSIPQIPNPERKIDQFEREAREADKESIQWIDELIVDIKASKLSQKQKDEFTNRLNIIRGRTQNSLAFVLKQFGEHMEATVNKARTEITTFAHNMLVKTGISGLKGGENVKKILGYEDREDQ